MLVKDTLRREIQGQVEEYLKSANSGIKQIPPGASGLDAEYGVSKKSKENFIIASKRGSESSRKSRS